MQETTERLRIIDARGDEGWRPRLEAHLLRLDAEARQMRFFSPIGDRGIRALVAGWSPLALVVHEPDGEIRGCAEILPGAAPGSAEVAVEVERAWQGRGIGARLTEAAMCEAARRGLSDVRLMCLRQNTPMLRIARALPLRALPLADWALALFRLETGEGGQPAG